MGQAGTMRAIAAGALLALGFAGSAAAQTPTVADLTAEIAAQVEEGIALSSGGSIDATGAVTTGGDSGIVSADGGNSLAVGDTPGGADGSGAYASR